MGHWLRLFTQRVPTALRNSTRGLPKEMPPSFIFVRLCRTNMRATLEKPFVSAIRRRAVTLGPEETLAGGLATISIPKDDGLRNGTQPLRELPIGVQLSHDARGCHVEDHTVSQGLV